MSNHVKARAIKDLHRLLYLKILSNCAGLYVLAILRGFSNITRSVNPLLHWYLYYYLSRVISAQIIFLSYLNYKCHFVAFYKRNIKILQL